MELKERMLMSVIAAIVKKGEGESFEIGLASDGQANYGDGYCSVSTPKLKIFGDERRQFVVGVVGSFRVLDLIFENEWSYIDFNDKASIPKFRDEIASLVGEESSKAYSASDDLGFQAVLACKQGLYVVYSDMQITSYGMYCAIGSGHEVASGSLFRDFKNGLFTVESASMGAVEAASAHRLDCGLGGMSITLTSDVTGVRVRSN
jgi:hypothetical protein